MDRETGRAKEEGERRGGEKIGGRRSKKNLGRVGSKEVGPRRGREREKRGSTQSICLVLTC